MTAEAEALRHELDQLKEKAVTNSAAGPTQR
jgi:hypothetical protein